MTNARDEATRLLSHLAGITRIPLVMSAKPTPDQQKMMCGLGQMTKLVELDARLENSRKDHGTSWNHLVILRGGVFLSTEESGIRPSTYL